MKLILILLGLLALTGCNSGNSISVSTPNLSGCAVGGIGTFSGTCTATVGH